MFTQPRTFRCVNCHEMINDSMTQCNFCSVPIDAGVAALLAERQDKANQAYSDASYLRNAAVAMFVFYAIGLILTIGYFAFVGALVVVLFLLVRWQVRYGELLTNDPDFLRARRSKNIALLLLIIAFPLGVVLNPFLDVILENLGLIGSSDEIGNLWLTKKVFAAVLFQ